jgi:putative membrane protein
MSAKPAHRRYLAILATIFVVIWLALAIDPLYRNDWMLENVLVVLFIVMALASYKRFVFSRVSMTLIFLFLCIHSVGAHYTYSKVPLDEWYSFFTGHTLRSAMGWERNHFDRLVHLCYGLMLAYPIREIFLRIANVRGFWGYFLPWDLTMSTSMMYELIEWAAAEIFGGELGMAYLGTQGDIWDAHKDMAFAGLGATIAVAIMVVINIYTQRDFSREWAESLRIKQAEPSEGPSV